MLSRDELRDTFQYVLGVVLGIPEAEVELNACLQSDLAIEEEDFEEIAAQLSQSLGRAVLASDLFDEDITVEQAVDILSS